MMIPTWLSIPICVVLPWCTAALFYFAGKAHRRRVDKREEQFLSLPIASAPPQRVSYDITINFAGKPEDHPDFRADILKVIENAAKEGAS